MSQLWPCGLPSTFSYWMADCINENHLDWMCSLHICTVLSWQTSYWPRSLEVWGVSFYLAAGSWAQPHTAPHTAREQTQFSSIRSVFGQDEGKIWLNAENEITTTCLLVSGGIQCPGNNRTRNNQLILTGITHVINPSTHCQRCEIHFAVGKNLVTKPHQSTDMSSSGSLSRM